MTQVRLTPDQRRDLIAKAAHHVAATQGIWCVNYKPVSQTVTVPTSEATVRRYFPRVIDLIRVAVARDKTGYLEGQARENGYDV